MKTLITLLLAAASTVAFADGNSATAKAEASVKLYAPITLVTTSNLSFGAIVVDDLAQAASVTFNPANGAATYDKCAALTGSKASGRSIAYFHYRKDATLAVDITLPPTVMLSGGTGPDVTLTPARESAAVCVLSSLANLPGTDRFHFGVAGKLDIPAGALGEKKGDLQVQVSYN